MIPLQSHGQPCCQIYYAISYDAYWIAILYANLLSHELDNSNTVEHIRVNNTCYWQLGRCSTAINT